MTTLTPQQDAFAQLVASGRSQAEAYRIAYPKSQKWKPETLFPAASKLMADAKVSTRVSVLRAAIQQQAINEAAVDKAYVMKHLKTVAERCLQSAPVLDKKGEPVLVETPEGEEAPAFAFNPMGANRALELLGKEIGMFVERAERGKPGEFADLKDRPTADLEREAREILEAGVKGGHLKLVKGKSQKVA